MVQPVTRARRGVYGESGGAGGASKVKGEGWGWQQIEVRGTELGNTNGGKTKTENSRAQRRGVQRERE